jgi:hypothetical protein
MSKKASGVAKTRDRAKSRPADRDAAEARREPAVEFLPPFKPRPRLFYALLTAFALWVGLLLGLYAFTVFPNQNAHDDPDPPVVAPQRETVSR